MFFSYLPFSSITVFVCVCVCLLFRFFIFIFCVPSACNASRAKNGSRAYLSWFNFKGGDQQKKVNLLSGGERNRLNLARTLKQARLISSDGV